MKAPMPTLTTHKPTGPGRIEQNLRAALTGPGRLAVTDSIGWDKSQVSRFLDNTAGVTLEKIDALVGSVGFVLVSTRYLEAVATLGEVGMHCECARQGRGECGSTSHC